MAGIMDFLNNNPEAVYSALGAVKGLGKDKQNEAIAAQEIAKTQWSPYLKTGPGDISKAQGGGALDGVMQGLLTGVAHRQDNDFNKKFFDALGKSKSSPYLKPNEVVLESSGIEQDVYNDAATQATQADEPRRMSVDTPGVVQHLLKGTLTPNEEASIGIKNFSPINPEHEKKMSFQAYGAPDSMNYQSSPYQKKPQMFSSPGGF